MLDNLLPMYVLNYSMLFKRIKIIFIQLTTDQYLNIFQVLFTNKLFISI